MRNTVQKYSVFAVIVQRLGEYSSCLERVSLLSGLVRETVEILENGITSARSDSR
ncbi:hypothetical protein [Shimazuella soli]|uniref:hypothetical protein n=1 Tax=Shimazuella soli TaxID=1892854 RepID=UPI001F0EB2BF|nr:hypothetical protein [Shimazuella soli]